MSWPGASPHPSAVPTGLLQPTRSCFPPPWALLQWGLGPRVTSGLPRPTVAVAPMWLQPPGMVRRQNQFAKHTQRLKCHWEKWGGTGHGTAVEVAPGKRPQSCPRPRDPPVGVEEDVDEHGGDGRQGVGGHGQDAEAGLGALHRMQRGAGGWERHPSGLGTVQQCHPVATSHSLAALRVRRYRAVGAGASLWGHRWPWETGWPWQVGTQHLVSLTRLGLEEAIACIVAGDGDALATLFLVDVELPRQRVDHHRQVPLPHLARGAGSGPAPPPLPTASPTTGQGQVGSSPSSTRANGPGAPGTTVPAIAWHSPG